MFLGNFLMTPETSRYLEKHQRYYMYKNSYMKEAGGFWWTPVK